MPSLYYQDFIAVLNNKDALSTTPDQFKRIGELDFGSDGDVIYFYSKKNVSIRFYTLDRKKGIVIHRNQDSIGENGTFLPFKGQFTQRTQKALGKQPAKVIKTKHGSRYEYIIQNYRLFDEITPNKTWKQVDYDTFFKHIKDRFILQEPGTTKFVMNPDYIDNDSSDDEEE